MSFDRPPPAEALRGDEPTAEPRPAATVILLRDGEQALEVLLVRRSPAQRFMADFWVFPGGAVDEGETLAQAALRELREEASVALPGEEALVPLSRWITPREVRVRFDTRFFVALAPPGCRPRADGSECVDVRWMAPQAALRAWREGQLKLVFPTIKHLELLAPLPSAEAAIAFARSREIRPIEPRVVVDEGSPRVVLPGEPGYERA